MNEVSASIKIYADMRELSIELALESQAKLGFDGMRTLPCCL
jgi:hypothetical protein